MFKITKMLLTLLLLVAPSMLLNAKDVNILAYIDRGIKYYPKYIKTGFVKYGKASWYGKPFHGRLTASGERYNMYSMTAAHRTYAMGTILKITNLDNKRSVKVRINDRGPFYSSRDIDLSYAAAKKLGIVKKGIGRIKIEVLSSGKNRQTRKRNKKRRKTPLKHHFKKKNIKKRHYVKHKHSKRHLARTNKIQIASFLTKKSAKVFIKKHRLKHVQIIKKSLHKKRKKVYAIILQCNKLEAKKVLKSKKFHGAFRIS
jgi:rare lipoprotein A